uniref:Uncharacterized protein n=1 Tax=Triticum urartu TaxID=4572 RepID=A0A8R7QS61_TRIUA
MERYILQYPRSKGLMFHEYEELIKKIRAQEREPRTPRIALHPRRRNKRRASHYSPN